MNIAGELGVEEGRDWNRVKLQTLLVLMSSTQDSNIISRRVQERVRSSVK